MSKLKELKQNEYIVISDDQSVNMYLNITDDEIINLLISGFETAVLRLKNGKIEYAHLYYYYNNNDESIANFVWKIPEIKKENDNYEI